MLPGSIWGARMPNETQFSRGRQPGAAGAAAKPRQQSAVTGKPGGCNCLLGRSPFSHFRRREQSREQQRDNKEHRDVADDPDVPQCHVARHDST